MKKLAIALGSPVWNASEVFACGLTIRVGCARHAYRRWLQSGKLPPLAAASGAVRSFRLRFSE